MRHTRAFAIVLIIGQMIGSVGLAESVSVQLEKALYQEGTVGDLDAAIEIYRQIIEDAEAHRRYVAEAWLRLGMCYHKKGQYAVASAAFNRLVQSFPEQEQLVAEANQQLGALASSHTDDVMAFGPATEFLPMNVKVERIVYDDGVRTNCFIDLDTGRLFSLGGSFPGQTDADAMAWIARQGIDAGAETAVRGPGLYGLDMVVIPRAAEVWEEAALHGIQDDLESGKSGSPVMMSALGELPRTYAFRTREGSMGILQITELINQPPRHINIRYKLLAHGAAPMQSGHTRRPSTAYQLGLACRMYAEDHEGLLPPDITALLDPYLPPAFDAESFELVADGNLREIEKPWQTVLLQEKTPNKEGQRVVVFADGHVEFIVDYIDLPVWRILASIGDGTPLPKGYGGQ